ncbi:MAG: ScpA family protein, partial [Gammaproteobacteria bacterium]
IPIAEITRQYMEYIELMKELRLELAAEYLVMAAMLAEIKSRMLLPRTAEAEEEEDPRAELIRRLQEYERFKRAAEDLDQMPRLERDLFPVAVQAPEKRVVAKPPEVSLKELLIAARNAMMRAEMFSHHHVQREPLSVRERMSLVLSRVGSGEFTDFAALFRPEEGRMGVVVSLLAVLELIKESLIELVQSESFAPIYIRATGSAAPVEEAPQAAAAEY